MVVNMRVTILIMTKVGNLDELRSDGYYYCRRLDIPN
jgi:hypothetical protein